MLQPILFYFPSFFDFSLPESFAGKLALMNPGLGKTGRSGCSGVEPSGVIKKVEEDFVSRLPLPPAEARAVLAELISLGNDHAGAGASLQNALLGEVFSAMGTEKSELSSLKLFAATGNTESEREAVSPEEERRTALIDCQKVLLLAFELEQSREELAGLERKADEAEKKLRQALGEGDDDDWAGLAEDGLAMDGLVIAPVNRNTVPWKIVFEAGLAFLPENASVFTADPDMGRELFEAGLLQPATAEQSQILSGWPEETANSLFRAEAAASDIIGRSRNSSRPWLDRVVEIFAVLPRI